MAAWQAIEPVTEGLGGAGGEILGGLWVLLVSWAALRTGGLPKALGWLGVAIGLVGIVSVVPALRDVGMIFGALQIVWLAWTGIVMLRTTERRGGGGARGRPRSRRPSPALIAWPGEHRLPRPHAYDRGVIAELHSAGAVPVLYRVPESPLKGEEGIFVLHSLRRALPELVEP